MTSATAARSTPLESKPAPAFPRSFWTANVTELAERAAYYSMASFVVLYLGQLGLGKTWPSNFNSALWFLVYFLPILSGTIADRVGFRKSLIVACLLLAAGYTAMGAPVWFFGASLLPQAGETITIATESLVPIVVGILLIGLGGSIVKPCISGTVQKTHMGRATLAFAIFYMVINIGSVVGRLVAYFVRNRPESNTSTIFAVAAVASLVALAVVLFVHRDPEQETGDEPKARRSMSEALLGIFRVLSNTRFLLFLLVSSGFYFIYNQVYNILPLYTRAVLEPKPAMELYTLANPLTIVLFQLIITRLFGKMKPIRSIVIGTVIIAASMLINIVPALMGGGPRATFANLLPIGSLFVIITVALIAFGELFSAARTFEYIGTLAPKGQEGLFLGYANLPMAIGALVSGPVGAWIFNSVICKGATKRPDGLLDLDTSQATLGWVILMAIGLLSALSMWGYNRWLQRHPAPEVATAR